MDSGQLDTLYNRAATVILELNEEIKTLSTKFGNTSPLVSKKADQLSALIQLHDESLQEIHTLRKALRMAEIVSHYKDVIIYQRESGLPWEKVAKLTGWSNETEARKLTSVDEKLDKFYIQLKDILNTQDEQGPGQ
jgi:hypothetical protein